MNKRFYLIALLTLCNLTKTIAQSFNSKTLETKIVSYPKNPLPEDFKNYTIKNSDKQNIGPFLSHSEVSSTLNFQSFSYSEQNPNFIIKYIASEPFITKTLSPQKNGEGKMEYRFTVKTTMSINLSVLDPTETKLIYNKQYKLNNITLDPKTGQPSTTFKQEPEELHYEIERIVSEKEIGEYFTISENGKKFRLTDSYRKQVLAAQLSRLILKAGKDLQKQFDLRIDKYFQRYYIIKKVDEEAKSDELYISLENTFKNIESVDDFYNTNIQDQLKFNQSIIDKYDANDKKQEKIIWASTFNQAFLFKVSKHFDKAKTYANKAVDYKIRGQVSKLLFTDILNAKDGYNRIFNSDGTRKLIQPKYKALIPENNTVSNSSNTAPKSIKEVKIDKLTGYVMNEKGDKEYEGNIYIEFSGNKTKKVLDLDTNQTTEEPSDDYAKEVLISYDKKGKTKAKKIKAKELYSFYINDTKETYEGFGTEKDALEKLMSLATLGGGNHKYYLIIHNAGKVKIYKDKSQAFDGTVLKLTKEEKGIKIPKTMESAKFLNQISDFYSKCKDLKEKIKKGEFSNSIDDHIKMADIYSGCVKK